MTLTSVTKYWSKHRSDWSRIFGIRAVCLLLIIKWLSVTLVKKNMRENIEVEVLLHQLASSPVNANCWQMVLLYYSFVFVFSWSSLTNANHKRLVSPLIRFQLIALAPIYKLSAVTEPNWKLIVNGAPMSRLHALYCRLAFQRKNQMKMKGLWLFVQVLGVGKKIAVDRRCMPCQQKNSGTRLFFQMDTSHNLLKF